MLTENQVIEAVVCYLKRQGWKVEQRLTTMERGIDVIATRGKTQRLLVEAKGGTSSKDHTERFGKPFNGGQVKSHVSVALYCAARLQGKHPRDAVALALPDDPRHRAAIEAIGAALRKLSIRVYFVGQDASICEWG